MQERVHYIDNLRWITVSLLILFHSAMAYNTWDEANYIFFTESKPIASLVTFIEPWFMPLMFLLAGVSARYSLEKRGKGNFIRERLLRLGIPLVFGVLVMVPVLTFIADKTHNGYAGSYFAHYRVYFTTFTDFTGYDGGFTFAHLWFIGVLIVISMLSCLFMKSGREERRVDHAASPASNPKTEESMQSVNPKTEGTSYSLTWIISTVMMSALAVASFDLRFFGKPLITYFLVYLLGYYDFSKKDIVGRIARYKWIWIFAFLLVSCMDVYLYIWKDGADTLNTVCYYASFAAGIPAMMSLGYAYLNRANRFTRYNAGISYVFYIIHFPVVVLCQYCLNRASVGYSANYILTVLIAYPVTYIFCYVIKNLKGLRILFGLK